MALYSYGLRDDLAARELLEHADRRRQAADAVHLFFLEMGRVCGGGCGGGCGGRIDQRAGACTIEASRLQRSGSAATADANAARSKPYEPMTEYSRDVRSWQKKRKISRRMPTAAAEGAGRRICKRRRGRRRVARDLQRYPSGITNMP